MKVSDFIVRFLIEKGITDVFGYPGGMVTHIMDSLDKYKEHISAHVNYHEQASAFSACGYAQASVKPGVAFATSGPGATNLMTGICHAYFDSISVIFITGQVNTYERKGNLLVRQKGFQEMDVVSMVKGVTKKAVYVDSVEDFPELFYQMYSLVISGRKGPVLLDIPMNIQREEIEESTALKYIKENTQEENSFRITEKTIVEKNLIRLLNNSKRPLIIAGAGIKQTGNAEIFRRCVNRLNIPVVTSMIAFDILERNDSHNFGFIGTYGNRAANFMISKADLIISVGSRLDCRQIGNDKSKFAPKATLFRVDIDQGEMTNKIKDDEIQCVLDIGEFFEILEEVIFSMESRYEDWWNIAFQLKETLKGMDFSQANQWIEEISNYFPDKSVVTTDVGQNQVWVSQSMNNRLSQKVLFSGGHGAMGYSLPAAIGAYYAERVPVISISGDGGLQMNLQELEFIRREKLPIKIILVNNHSLGMIRHFQEMYFDSEFSQTIEERGYTVPDFAKIAQAYEIPYMKLETIDCIKKTENLFCDDKPQFIEIDISTPTYVHPKLSINKSIEDQEPPLDRDLFEQLRKL